MALKPGNLAAYNKRAISLASLGRHQEAAQQFARVLAVNPNHPEAHNNLGAVLQTLGRTQEAIGHYARAIALRADYPEPHFNLGNALIASGRTEEAIASYDAALAIRPNYPEALYNRGNALKRLNRNAEAAASYEKTLELRPDYMEAYNNLGNALLDLRRFDEAAMRFEQAIALKPDSPEAHNNLGTALQALGRHDEAMKHYEKALALKPDYADAHTNIGNTLMEMGRLAEARRAFEAAIEINPRRPKFYRNLMDSKRFAAGDPQIAAMQALAKEMSSFDADEQIDLHFALGKALEDIGDHAASFRHLIEGNALKRRHVAYNEATVLGLMSSLAAVFTREMIEAKRGKGNPSRLPVFIVGMPRSGTTLIEQILSSHPNAFGAGELSAFTDIMAGFEGLEAALGKPDAAWGDEALHELGTRYLDKITPLAPAAQRITDKMPGNFRLVGLIRLALPNARIIHARRNPVDTCLSCFARAFTGDQPFTYDLGELGRYYRAYDRLMAHWRAVLPEETFLEVNYEDVVADLEGQARRIVAHCGLEWDAACLEFHRTERLVRTASATQVRQPIYKTSVGRWRAYGDLLRPLLDALGPELTGERPSPRRDDGATAAQAFETAVSLHRQDRLAEAAQGYGAILAADPGHFGALHGLGLLRARQGQMDEAMRLIGEALRRNPNSAEAYNDLGRILFGVRRYDDALVIYQAAVALKPEFVDALGGLAATLQAVNRPQDAIAPYQKALSLRPAPYLHNNLGNALVSANRAADAIAQYEQALAMKPDFAEAYGNLGVALQALRRFAEAERAHRQALALRPDYFDAHYNLGVVLWAMDRRDEAIASYDRAVALNPGSADAQASLGKLLLETGRIGDAVAAFERAIDAAPGTPAFYRSLADARRFVPGDPRISAMERLAARLDALAPNQQTELHFALGKAYADIGQPDRAFRHLREGNALKRRQIEYDEAATLQSFERIKAAFTPAVMAAKRGLGDPSPVPVFVVGMWRSGTTLIEQILSSSPRVFGAGELNHIAQAIADLGRDQGTPFPEAVRDMGGEQLRALGAAYLARLKAASPDADVVVDKMPVNFRYLGLIHLALPNARIVHARRNPLDTCWSCFSRLFTNEQPYIYDLGELGRYYRAYHALMEHWRRVLPDGVMIDVDYEDIVAHTEREARRILAHGRVSWDPACLEFHKTVRPVRSASAVQVREPIYTASIGRWRAYRGHLAPLIEALGEDLAGTGGPAAASAHR